MSDPRKDSKSGTWYFVEEARSSSGARRQVKRRGFATKREAVDARKALLAELAHGTLADPSRLTVEAYLVEQWLPNLENRGSVAATTLDGYRKTVRNYLVPELGSIKLQALELRMIEHALGELGRRLSPKTVRNVHGCLAAALRDALRWRLVTCNEAHGVALPSLERRPPRAWSLEELSTFLARTDRDRSAALWRFLASTATRRSEVAGLRWANVDLDAGTATIAEARVACTGGVVTKETKSRAGARTIELEPETVAALVAWRAAQRVEYVALGVRPDHGLVFTNPAGEGISPNYPTKRFIALCDELGLRRIGVHGLRHSLATFLVGSGESPKLVSTLLGHASIGQTLDTYAHVMPGHGRAAAERYADALRSSSVTIP